MYNSCILAKLRDVRVFQIVIVEGKERRFNNGNFTFTMKVSFATRDERKSTTFSDLGS
jgi:hypothetical protein